MRSRRSQIDSAKRPREERQDVLRPDVHAPGAAEAVALLVKRHIGGIDLHGVLLTAPLELDAEDPPRLEARILRGLDQGNRNLRLPYRRHQAIAERRVALPALGTRPGRPGPAVARAAR